MSWIKLTDRAPTDADYPIWVCQAGAPKPWLVTYRSGDVYTHWQPANAPTPPHKPTPGEVLRAEAQAACPFYLNTNELEGEEWINGYMVGVLAERKWVLTHLFPEPCGAADTRQSNLEEIHQRVSNTP